MDGLERKLFQVQCISRSFFNNHIYHHNIHQEHWFHRDNKDSKSHRDNTTQGQEEPYSLDLQEKIKMNWRSKSSVVGTYDKFYLLLCIGYWCLVLPVVMRMCRPQLQQLDGPQHDPQPPQQDMLN